ncbi:hypothetical protein EV401DRAFT_1625588 [Pisolithus croceorrhizus]|nr:hypothetical protein EV401DRAFT_1625588 [Pisolithus croceorrhizus]
MIRATAGFCAPATLLCSIGMTVMLYSGYSLNAPWTEPADVLQLKMIGRLSMGCCETRIPNDNHDASWCACGGTHSIIFISLSMDCASGNTFHLHTECNRNEWFSLSCSTLGRVLPFLDSFVWGQSRAQRRGAGCRKTEAMISLQHC